MLHADCQSRIAGAARCGGRPAPARHRAAGAAPHPAAAGALILAHRASHCRAQVVVEAVLDGGADPLSWVDYALALSRHRAVTAIIAGE